MWKVIFLIVQFWVAFPCLGSLCVDGFTFPSLLHGWHHHQQQNLNNNNINNPIPPPPTRRHKQRANQGQLKFFNFFGTGGPDRVVQAEEEKQQLVLKEIKDDVEELIISCSGTTSVETLEPMFSKIEELNTYDEPNRSIKYKGKWYVWYTDCPPPSNGKLGPFQGSAEQDISLSASAAAAADSQSYNNILRLPPNSPDNEWLTVILDGIWEDWDGIELPDENNGGRSNNNNNNGNQRNEDQDWGAKFWKVTFLKLRFIFFGKELISKDFPPDTARVWRTTYLDDTTRIVRAGRTGRLDDESVFYMRREPRPSARPS